MAKNMYTALLFDFYGDMLTDKQREVMDNYYNNDLSLSEIAENEGISRQGVRDSIKRAEVQLTDMESRLHFAERFRRVKESADAITLCAREIAAENERIGASPKIDDRVVRIVGLADKIIKL